MAYKSQPTVTRPANTTAYTADDAVGTSFQFTGIPSGLSGGLDLMVISASLRINVAAVPSGMGGFRVHLWNGNPASTAADNAAFDLASGDRAAYLGFVEVGTPVDLGATIYAQADQLNKPVRLTGSGLYGQIQTKAGYTPAGNSEEYIPELVLIPL